MPIRLRLSKNLGERERAEALSQKIEPDGVYVGLGADFCVGKSYFPEQKSLPCSFRARPSQTLCKPPV